jgi:hypothetical protein
LTSERRSQRPLEYAKEPITEAARKQIIEELIDFLEARALVRLRF